MRDTRYDSIAARTTTISRGAQKKGRSFRWPVIQGNGIPTGWSRDFNSRDVFNWINAVDDFGMSDGLLEARKELRL